jgi:hypothetical protein
MAHARLEVCVAVRRHAAVQRLEVAVRLLQLHGAPR